ncbi:MAG: LysR family transcriptional regulator [Gammaproteobacteria bacterium]|nr:LysR family transcriptional regulator [Gammaproteobacteria bacterium]
MINWDHLRFFTLVAEHGSVAAAGRAARVSHATILRAMGRLESDLGLRLFDHLRTGYRLTPEGSELLEHAQRMGDEARTIVRKAQSQGDEPAGDLRIAMPEPGITDLMPLLAGFGASYPQVNLRLTTQNIDATHTLLEADIRVAFMLTNDPPEDLVGRKIDTVAFTVARHRDTPDDGAWIDWRPAFVDASSHQRLRTERCAAGHYRWQSWPGMECRQ